MKAYIYNENGIMNRGLECENFSVVRDSWFVFYHGRDDDGYLKAVLYTSHPFFTESDISEPVQPEEDGTIADITLTIGDQLVKWSDCTHLIFSYDILYFVCGNKNFSVHGTVNVDNIREIK